jgi:hypothetical protein
MSGKPDIRGRRPGPFILRGPRYARAPQDDGVIVRAMAGRYMPNRATLKGKNGVFCQKYRQNE